MSTESTEAAPPGGSAGRGGGRQKIAAMLLPYYYVGPALIIMAAITFYPLFYQIYLSFMNLKAANLMVGARPVGLENYKDILSSFDSDFYVVTLRTFAWTFINVFFHITLGVFLAIQLNKKGLRFARVYRTMLILPCAVPAGVSALMWRTTLFDYNFGAFNQILNAAGLTSVSWLQDSTNAFIAVIVFNVWAGVPFMMMVASGALQTIPEELYEAAVIDGATPLQQHWQITLPLIRPAMIPSVVLGLIWTFNNFLAVYLITGGGPNGKTDILLTYIYRIAFLGNGFLYSVASAIAVIVFFILVGFVLLNIRLTGAMKET
jgi:arabinogalactan oligomer/maltooligosaccharide transport system permease protein